MQLMLPRIKEMLQQGMIQKEVEEALGLLLLDKFIQLVVVLLTYSEG